MKRLFRKSKILLVILIVITILTLGFIIYRYRAKIKEKKNNEDLTLLEDNKEIHYESVEEEIGGFNITLKKRSDYEITKTILEDKGWVTTKEVLLTKGDNKLSFVISRFDTKGEYINATGGLHRQPWPLTDEYIKIGEMEDREILIHPSEGSNITGKKAYNVCMRKPEEKFVTPSLDLWAQNKDLDEIFINFLIEDSSNLETVKQEMIDMILSLKKVD